ncbi:hypothetical protein [Nocardiopsis coralliicola]
MRKITAAGLLAGAAMGAVLMAAPAQADDQQYGQNLQGVPVELCNTNVGAAIGLAVPVLSPQTTGDCTNGAVSTNIED